MSDQSETSKPSGVSRRGFLKGMGLGTVATGLLPSLGVPEANAFESKISGPGEIPIALRINGTVRKLNVEPRVTLLDALRNRLDLTGSKKVCDRGTCGACTVLLDGHPIYSCSLLAIEALGREVTTIEGLGSPTQLNAVQQAFVKNDAQQCGFCTSGFVVACTAFLQKNPHPVRADLRDGLGGNLCRCGTYAGIVEVALEASQEVKGGAPWQK